MLITEHNPVESNLFGCICDFNSALAILNQLWWHDLSKRCGASEVIINRLLFGISVLDLEFAPNLRSVNSELDIMLHGLEIDTQN